MLVGEVADALAQHRRRVPCEAGAPLEHHQVERLLGAQVLLDQLLDAARELAVVENRHLYVEDRCLLGAGGGLDTLAQVAQPLLGPGDRFVESLDFRRDALVRNDPMAHVGHLPAQEVHVSDDDTRRSGNATDLPVHYRSPNLLLMSVAIASSAASASAPSARITSEEPHSAASIMTPMMLLPFTSMPSFTSVISLWNFDEIFTISAAGRAWSPFLLTICTVRSTISEPPRRGRRERSARGRACSLPRGRAVARAPRR